MLSYSWPILVLGIAGILNQTADKMLFPYIYKDGDMLEQLGIYGACSKIAMIMAMITQAFRFAYEPIVFSGVKDKGQREMYEQAMKYFIIFTLLAFLMVVGYIDILKYIVRNPDYWVGLKVVPVVMAAEIMMGIYFNLSFWYKLIDKTIWGAWFSGIGCVVLLAVNFLFVPKYGFMACAWGGVAGYGVAMVTSYIVGQKYYPLNYPLKEIAYYTIFAVVAFVVMMLLREHLPMWLSIVCNTGFIVLFVGMIIKKDLPLSSLPVIGRRFRKKPGYSGSPGNSGNPGNPGESRE
jgi:O-antigen/teichoic acid export membrane protein